MSKIYFPPGQPFDPLYIDTLRNALTRFSVEASGNNLALTEITRINLVANTFDILAKKMSMLIHGGFIGAVAVNTKRIVVQFDATIVFDSGLVGIDNNIYILKVEGIRRAGNILSVLSRNDFNPFGASTITASQQSTVNVANVDFSIAHTISFLAQVSNVANSVEIQTITADVI